MPPLDPACLPPGVRSRFLEGANGLRVHLPDAVAPFMPAAEAPWLTDAELAIYVEEYARTGFQGGLDWCRLRTGGHHARELSTFAGRTADVPSC